MDEHGDICSPQVITRFNVTDCIGQQPVADDADASEAPSSWSILQRDSTFSAGWPSVLYSRLLVDAAPQFLISPPPISARLHVIMEGIFASIVVPEYAQLMGVNHKAPAIDVDAGSGSSGVVDNYKYIPVSLGYHVDVKSSFASPPLKSIQCPLPSTCTGAGISSLTDLQTCKTNAFNSGHSRRAVTTLVTSDSYLQGALLLLYVGPPPAPVRCLRFATCHFLPKLLTPLLISSVTV
jgi:hypothetical protein